MAGLAAAALAHGPRGLSSRCAASRLCRCIRDVLAAEAARIRREHSSARVAADRLLRGDSGILIACALMLVLEFILDETHPASFMVCAVIVLVLLAVSILLVVRRARILAWEHHQRMRAALLQYEATVVPRLYGGPDAGGARLVASALDLHTPPSRVAAPLTYRDGAWTRVPGMLLVRGDLIALVHGDFAPATLLPLDGPTAGAGGAGRSRSFASLAEAAAAAAAPAAEVEVVPMGTRITRATTTGGTGAGARGPADATVAGGGEGGMRRSVSLVGVATADAGGGSSSTGGDDEASGGGAAAAGVGGATGGGGGSGAPGGHTAAYNHDAELLRLCGDMRRYVVVETPAVSQLKHRLRTPLRNEPLFLIQFREFTTLAARVQLVLVCTSLLITIMRTTVGPPTVAWARLILEANVTVALCCCPLVTPMLLTIGEGIATAHVTALHEITQLRSQWDSRLRGGEGPPRDTGGGGGGKPGGGERDHDAADGGEGAGPVPREDIESLKSAPAYATLRADMAAVGVTAEHLTSTNWRVVRVARMWHHFKMCVCVRVWARGGGVARTLARAWREP